MEAKKVDNVETLKVKANGYEEDDDTMLWMLKITRLSGICKMKIQQTYLILE
jgi:hypothetical protein